MESGALSRLAYAAAAVAAFVLLESLWVHHPARIVLLLAEATLVIAAVQPMSGLLLLAGLGPLATVFLTAVRDNAGGTRFAEVLALAFIAGAAANRAVARRPSAAPSPLVWAAVPLIAAVLASAVVAGAVLRAEQPALTRGGAFPIVLVRDYLMLSNGVTRAVQFAEGLVILLLAAGICGGDAARRTRVLRMMILAAAAAASFNVLRLVTAAMGQPPFWSRLVSIATGFRINVHFPDWNAAGSYFAMLLVIGAVFALRRPLVYALPVLLVAAGLWLTGSRTAFAAVALAGAVLASVELRRRGGSQAGGLAVLAVLIMLAVAAWNYYPQQRNDPVAFSFSTRMALSKAGLRMAADYPVFGVGLSRFYDLSDEYAGDVLRSFGRERENAHDYFVQMLAELGVPAFLFFLAVLGVSLRRAWPPRGAALAEWALPAGLITYLVTCLTGHPLITPEASYPFWLALGVAASAGGALPRHRWPRIAAALATIVFAASVPLRAIDAVHHAHLENTAIGLSLWQRSADNVRYRWAERRSTFFVDASATTITIPFRLGPAAPGPLAVRILVNDKEANRVVVSHRDDWQAVRFVAAQGVRGDFVRIDVEVDPPSAIAAAPFGHIPEALAVGQATVMWDADGPASDVPLLGDIDGDGRADLIVWSVEGGRWRWSLSSTDYQESIPGTSAPPRHHPGGIPLTGDLDGDHRSDLVVWRSSTATWDWLESSSGYRQASVRSIAWHDAPNGAVPLLADIDGDGRDDLVLWHAATRTWAWRTSSSGYTSGGSATVPPGAPGEQGVALAGRLGGRGVLGLWTATSAGARLDWLAPGSAALPSIRWPDRQPLDVPLLADVDRDGRPDPVAWRPATGEWSWLSSSAGFAPSPGNARQWGRGDLGDVPLLADLDGDGAIDFVVWRASTRTWYWLTSSSRYGSAAARLKPWKF